MLISTQIDAEVNNRRKLDKLKVGEKYYLQMRSHIKFEGEGIRYSWAKAVYQGISGVNDKILIFRGRYSQYDINDNALMTVNTLDYLQNTGIILTSEEYYNKMNNEQN